MVDHPGGMKGGTMGGRSGGRPSGGRPSGGPGRMPNQSDMQDLSSPTKFWIKNIKLADK